MNCRPFLLNRRRNSKRKGDKEVGGRTREGKGAVVGRGGGGKVVGSDGVGGVGRRKREDKANGKGSGSGSGNRRRMTESTIETQQCRVREWAVLCCTVLQVQ